MSADVSIEPVELRAPRGSKSLTLVWSDGAEITYPHALLRGFCPCAHCQGHQGAIRWAQGVTDADLDVLDIEEVGNYAVRLVFGDGHSTGIYSFRFLRDLGAAVGKPQDEIRAMQFHR